MGDREDGIHGLCRRFIPPGGPAGGEVPVIGVWQVKGSCLRERGSKSLFTVYVSICVLSGGWKHGKTGGTNPAAGVEQLGLLRRKCTGRGSQGQCRVYGGKPQRIQL